MGLIYLNNFPRENAIKGQEFKGDSDLKSELLKRGIIGEGEVTTISNDKKELEEQNRILKAELEKVKKSNEPLLLEIETLKAIIQDAVASAKDKKPESLLEYEKGE